MHNISKNSYRKKIYLLELLNNSSSLSPSSKSIAQEKLISVKADYDAIVPLSLPKNFAAARRDALTKYDFIVDIFASFWYCSLSEFTVHGYLNGKDVCNFMHFLYSVLLNSKTGQTSFDIDAEVLVLRKYYGAFDKISIFDCFIDFIESWIDLVKEDQRREFFWVFLTATMDFSRAYPPYINQLSTAKCLFNIDENAEFILQGFIGNKYNVNNLNNLLSLSPVLLADINKNKLILARQKLGQKLFNFSRISVSTSPSQKFRHQTVVQVLNSQTDEYGFEKGNVSVILNNLNTTINDDNKLYVDLKWAPIGNFDSSIELILCENDEMSFSSNLGGSKNAGGSSVQTPSILTKSSNSRRSILSNKKLSDKNKKQLTHEKMIQVRKNRGSLVDHSGPKAVDFNEDELLIGTKKKVGRGIAPISNNQPSMVSHRTSSPQRFVCKDTNDDISTHGSSNNNGNYINDNYNSNSAHSREKKQSEIFTDSLTHYTGDASRPSTFNLGHTGDDSNNANLNLESYASTDAIQQQLQQLQQQQPLEALSIDSIESRERNINYIDNDDISEQSGKSFHVLTKTTVIRNKKRIMRGRTVEPVDFFERNFPGEIKRDEKSFNPLQSNSSLFFQEFDEFQGSIHDELVNEKLLKSPSTDVPSNSCSPPSSPLALLSPFPSARLLPIMSGDGFLNHPRSRHGLSTDRKSPPSNKNSSSNNNNNNNNNDSSDQFHANELLFDEDKSELMSDFAEDEVSQSNSNISDEFTSDFTIHINYDNDNNNSSNNGDSSPSSPSHKGASGSGSLQSIQAPLNVPNPQYNKKRPNYDKINRINMNELFGDNESVHSIKSHSSSMSSLSGTQSSKLHVSSSRTKNSSKKVTKPLSSITRGAVNTMLPVSNQLSKIMLEHNYYKGGRGAEGNQRKNNINMSSSVNSVNSLSLNSFNDYSLNSADTSQLHSSLLEEGEDRNLHDLDVLEDGSVDDSTIASQDFLSDIVIKDTNNNNNGDRDDFSIESGCLFSVDQSYLKSFNGRERADDTDIGLENDNQQGNKANLTIEFTDTISGSSISNTQQKSKKWSLYEHGPKPDVEVVSNKSKNLPFPVYSQPFYNLNIAKLPTSFDSLAPTRSRFGEWTPDNSNSELSRHLPFRNDRKVNAYKAWSDRKETSKYVKVDPSEAMSIVRRQGSVRNIFENYVKDFR